MIKDLNNKVTIDSSVIISYLLKSEIRSKEAVEIWEQIILKNIKIINPSITVIEIVSAVIRRTNDIKLATKIEKEFLSNTLFNFVNLNSIRLTEILNILKTTRLKALDAIILQTAIEFDTQLITFDKELESAYNQYIIKE